MPAGRTRRDPDPHARCAVHRDRRTRSPRRWAWGRLVLSLSTRPGRWRRSADPAAPLPRRQRHREGTVREHGWLNLYGTLRPVPAACRRAACGCSTSHARGTARRGGLTTAAAGRPAPDRAADRPRRGPPRPNACPPRSSLGAVLPVPVLQAAHCTTVTGQQPDRRGAGARATAWRSRRQPPTRSSSCPGSPAGDDATPRPAPPPGLPWRRQPAAGVTSFIGDIPPSRSPASADPASEGSGARLCDAFHEPEPELRDPRAQRTHRL